MKKITARFASLLVVMMMVLSLSIPALAVCVHEKDDVNYELIPGSGQYISSSQCRAKYTVSWVCEHCGDSFYDGTAYLTSSHQYQVYDSSCNGTMQTWREKCIACNHGTTTQHACPKGPHTGGCNWLPAGVGPKLEIK